MEARLGPLADARGSETAVAARKRRWRLGNGGGGIGNGGGGLGNGGGGIGNGGGGIGNGGGGIGKGGGGRDWKTVWCLGCISLYAGLRNSF